MFLMYEVFIGQSLLYSLNFSRYKIFAKSLKIGYSHLNFHEILADSDLNFHINLNIHDYIFRTVNFLAKFAKI